jgi:hydrogenase maturation protein HypF
MKSVQIQVQGIVQGVGFRPFVYNLAQENKLKGYVNNDDAGVNILIQGHEFDIEQFLLTLEQQPPVLAKIDHIHKHVLSDSEHFTDFNIIQSETTQHKSTIVSPDMAVCESCVEDILDKSNFRYHYALTNCTNCGPRYSILKTVPYDRMNTSMAPFELCSVCQKEYDDPTNRRYHAQPVACESCGPKIALYDTNDTVLSQNDNAIKQLAGFIEKGKIVAMKGLGGFHIMCDATNEEVVAMLRQRKNRHSKPFAVMFKNSDYLYGYVKATTKEKEIIHSKESPITLVRKKENTDLASNVAPNIDRLGVFLPYTPLHMVLFEYINTPLIATSANLSDEPIIRFRHELLDKLSGVVDFVLDFDRDIINACDDSVVQSMNDDLFVVRNARGYAPTALKLPFKTPKPILSVGANQKNTIALAFEDNLIISPHIGDLNSIESMEYFKRTVDTFQRFYDFEPEVIVCDKHPSYETTKWSKKQQHLKSIELIQVQHHYAHVLATMAEYDLQGEFLAFAFDGTGYGDDGKIWGAEVFNVTEHSYERLYHLEYFKLLGSEKAIKEPKRVALSLLFDVYSFEEVLRLDCPTVHSFNQSELKMLHTVWQRELNAPQASSLGRLFDAIASFAGVLHVQNYEGETGLALEKLYNWNCAQAYSYELTDTTIDIKKAIIEIVHDNEPSAIATKFINMLSNIIIDISSSYEQLPIILTGGVFQNKILLELTCKRLEDLGKTFYHGKKIPLNDGGISVGQIYAYLHQYSK